MKVVKVDYKLIDRFNSVCNGVEYDYEVSESNDEIVLISMNDDKEIVDHITWENNLVNRNLVNNAIIEMKNRV